MSEEYYLQDSRGYVGNDMLFWREGGGYTTDLNEAELFTRESALRHNQDRETDIPWPKEYVESKTRPAVDVQFVDIEEALYGLGIELKQPKPYVKPVYRCYGCGLFMSEYAYHSAPCTNCGVDNRP